MLSIDTVAWKLRELPGGIIQVTQRATGVTRTANRSEFSSNEMLASMHENKFNQECRRAFHREPNVRKGI